MFHNASVCSPRCQTRRGPAAAAVIRAPESPKAICRVFMLLPPPPLLLNCLYLLSNRLCSHSCSQMAWLRLQQACSDPSPFQKQPLSYSAWRTVRFKSSPPFSSDPRGALKLQSCPLRLRKEDKAPPILAGVVAFDRQLLSLNRKLLDPSLKCSWR